MSAWLRSPPRTRSWSEPITPADGDTVGSHLVRIARFTTGDEPQYGVVGGAEGDEIVASVIGDPLYAGVELTGEQLPLADVRLLAPVIPRSKVVCIGRNYV